MGTHHLCFIAPFYFGEIEVGFSKEAASDFQITAVASREVIGQLCHLEVWT